MHRVVWIYVSPPIVQSVDDLEKKVKRIKEKARKKEMKMVRLKIIVYERAYEL